MHIYMEVTQGNTLYSYLKQAKIPFFSSFFFAYTKSENRRVEQVLPGEVCTARRWGNGEEG
jgi:chloramphenicol O-acetyltransferase